MSGLIGPPDPADAQRADIDLRFGQMTSGLVDASGRPLGFTEVERDLIVGVEWGMAFIMLKGDIVGLCHLDPDDCWVTDVRVGTDPNAPLMQTLNLRVKPEAHQFLNNWDGVPGTALEVLRQRKAHAAHLAEQAAAAEQAVAEAQAAVDAAYQEATGGPAPAPIEPGPVDGHETVVPIDERWGIEVDEWYERITALADNATPEMTAVAAAIKAFYQHPECGVGGPLHIVIEDNNVETHHIEWCMSPERNLEADWPADVIADARKIADSLLALTEDARAAVTEVLTSPFRVPPAPTDADDAPPSDAEGTPAPTE